MIKEVNYVYEIIHFSVLTKYLFMYLDGNINVRLEEGGKI